MPRGRMGVLVGWAFSYERGRTLGPTKLLRTPVGPVLRARSWRTNREPLGHFLSVLFYTGTNWAADPRMAPVLGAVVR